MRDITEIFCSREYCSRTKQSFGPVAYDTTELSMTDEEVEQHDVPLEGLLTETISRALNRLIRFMTRFVELGNEKNHVRYKYFQFTNPMSFLQMIRENPSHGSSVPGHSVTFSIELKNDDDDMDVSLHFPVLPRP